MCTSSESDRDLSFEGMLRWFYGGTPPPDEAEATPPTAPAPAVPVAGEG